MDRTISYIWTRISELEANKALPEDTRRVAVLTLRALAGELEQLRAYEELTVYVPMPDNDRRS